MYAAREGAPGANLPIRTRSPYSTPGWCGRDVERSVMQRGHEVFLSLCPLKFSFPLLSFLSGWSLWQFHKDPNMPMCQTHLRPTPEAVTSALWAPPHQNRYRIRLSFSITQMPPRSVNSVPALLHRLALPFIQAPLLWHRFIPSSQIIAVFSRTALL